MTKFKKSYIGKNWKKIFGPKSVFDNLTFSRTKYVKIIFRDQETDKKIVSYKIPIQEYELIMLAAQITDETFETFVLNAVREYVDQKYAFPID